MADSTPRWEQQARERVRAALRKYAEPLAALVARDANEADTRLLVTDFLCDALGYDKFTELTTEHRVKNEFADYAIKVDGKLVAFVEAKRATAKLHDRHLRQVELYAVNEGVEWMILTNGAHWQAYHLEPGMPVKIDLVLDANILGEQGRDEKVKSFFPLTRESFKRGLISELWRAASALAPETIAGALCSDQVMNELRRELRRRTGRLVDVAELRAALNAGVLRDLAPKS